MRPRRSERGSVTVELVLLAPLVGILLAAVVLVGRVQSARADLEGAARAAARDLSIARDPPATLEQAEATAAAAVNVGSPTCRSMTFTPTITAADVTVTISCLVDLQAASVLPVPATMTVDAVAREVVDVHRESPDR